MRIIRTLTALAAALLFALASSSTAAATSIYTVQTVANQHQSKHATTLRITCETGHVYDVKLRVGSTWQGWKASEFDTDCWAADVYVPHNYDVVICRDWTASGCVKVNRRLTSTGWRHLPQLDRIESVVVTGNGKAVR